MYIIMYICHTNEEELCISNSQEIDIRVFCNKGIGKDHAKFSPVGECFIQNDNVIHNLLVVAVYR